MIILYEEVKQSWEVDVLVFVAMGENVYHLFVATAKSIQSYFQIMKRNELKNNLFTIIRQRLGCMGNN